MLKASSQVNVKRGAKALRFCGVSNWSKVHGRTLLTSFGTKKARDYETTSPPRKDRSAYGNFTVLALRAQSFEIMLFYSEMKKEARFDWEFVDK